MPALVTVFSLTYNHEAYIARALEGMVSQKTDFPYEIIVHDDASTDRTAEILREYEARYPDKIRGYYEKENQFYNPNIHITRDLLVPLSSGKYFAFCECDDEWTDPLKLQREVDFLESHPDYSMCVHTAYRHVVGTDEAEDKIFPELSEDRDFEGGEIIRDGAGMFATNSYLMRREIYLEQPDCFRTTENSDYTLLMYAAFEGKVHCLSRPMSRYNVGVANSWTERIWKDPEKHAQHQREIAEMLKQTAAYYKGRYEADFANEIAEREADALEMEYQAALKKGDRKELKKKVYQPLIKRDRNIAFHVMLNKRFPWLVRLKHKIIKDK